MIRGLPATVWMLGAISFLNDAASDLVYPLVPLFVAQVLGAGPRALGIIEGLANATAALLKLVSGALYDRFPRAKGWILAGYGLPALARPAIAFASPAWTLGALRIADRIGKGLRSAPRDALLGVPAASIPLLWAVQSTIAMLLSTPLSSLSDRVPRLWLICGGWLLYAVVFGVVGASVDTLAGIAALLAFYGVVLALTEGVEKAMVADLVPTQRLGTAFGWFHLVTGLALVPASAGFGWTWERFGAPAAFGASGVIGAVAAVWLAASMRRRAPAASGH